MGEGGGSLGGLLLKTALNYANTKEFKKVIIYVILAKVSQQILLRIVVWLINLFDSFV